ncbi:MAG TPA: hypothetical protein PJ986_02575 [Gammaproteobacteria bacterium]|nr:hypothetical protein [Gammaproteobacteria bacterium]
MDAITPQRLSGMLARSFSSFPSNRAAEGQCAQRGQDVRRPRSDHHRCDRPQKTSANNEAEASAKLSYRRSEGTSLFIETREGDTVELKIAVRQSTSLTATQKQDGEQTSTAVDQTSKLGVRVSFEVDGELNEEERAAIDGVLDQIGQLAQQFFGDDVAGAFDAAAALKIDASQLASVGLELSLREQMTYTSKGLPANVIPLPAASPAPAASPSPSAAPVAAASIATSAANTAPAEIATESTPTPAASAPAAPEQAPSAATADADAPTQTPSAQEAIRGFLTQLLEKLSAPAPGTASGASLELSLKLRIFQSVVTQAAATKAADTGTAATLSPLVPETLDTLAARQEAPLQAVA